MTRAQAEASQIYYRPLKEVLCCRATSPAAALARALMRRTLRAKAQAPAAAVLSCTSASHSRSTTCTTACRLLSWQHGSTTMNPSWHHTRDGHALLLPRAPAPLFEELRLQRHNQGAGMDGHRRVGQALHCSWCSAGHHAACVANHHQRLYPGCFHSRRRKGSCRLELQGATWRSKIDLRTGF